jgi:hypothetical protein
MSRRGRALDLHGAFTNPSPTLHGARPKLFLALNRFNLTGERSKRCTQHIWVAWGLASDF